MQFICFIWLDFDEENLSFCVQKSLCGLMVKVLVTLPWGCKFLFGQLPMTHMYTHAHTHINIHLCTLLKIWTTHDYDDGWHVTMVGVISFEATFTILPLFLVIVGYSTQCYFLQFLSIFGYFTQSIFHYCKLLHLMLLLAILGYL